MGRRKNDEVVREIARYTYDWINSYVPNLRTNSEHTVRAYTTAVNLYISFLESYGIKADSFTTECFSANHITDWLLWLRTKRNSSSRTCYNRLAAIKCLLKYIGMRNKAYQFLYIDASDSVKRLKEPRKQVHGMTKEAVKALLATPDPNTKIGLRDIAIMSFEYGTATRIDEVLSIKIRQLHMNGEKPYVTVIGKGSKIRSMYLMSGLVETLRKYIAVFHGENPKPDDYLFYSSWHDSKAKLSQEAIRKRLKLYAAKAHEICPDVPTDLHSHQWRHAKACHWLEDGINIVEISKLLGHESLETTMIYQEITREKQIRALATLDEEISKGTPKKWKQPNARNLRDYFCFV